MEAEAALADLNGELLPAAARQFQAFDPAPGAMAEFQAVSGGSAFMLPSTNSTTSGCGSARHQASRSTVSRYSR